MSKIFKSVVTVAGRKKIAAAIVSGNKVVFSQMSVGDGRGTTIIPDENQNSLINECFRTQL
ncbi:phage tail protein, partial [Klebsiella pneumoniae]